MTEFAALRNQPRYEEIRDERGVLISRRLIAEQERIMAASTRGEATYPHASRDGKQTLCGLKVEELGGEFKNLLPASSCPYCFREASAR